MESLNMQKMLDYHFLFVTSFQCMLHICDSFMGILYITFSVVAEIA
jgi:hypothetical protein